MARGTLHPRAAVHRNAHAAVLQLHDVRAWAPAAFTMPIRAFTIARNPRSQTAALAASSDRPRRRGTVGRARRRSHHSSAGHAVARDRSHHAICGHPPRSRAIDNKRDYSTNCGSASFSRAM
jgi:hypothetical protein